MVCHLHLRRVYSGFSVPRMNDVTRLLSAIDQGDPHAAEQLLPLVYDELRKLAAQKLAQEQPGQTLQATALVHEAYLQNYPASSAGQLIEVYTALNKPDEVAKWRAEWAKHDRLAPKPEGKK